MFPLHLNYTTTLPCKTITTKITIFVIVLVLKSNENVSDRHSLLFKTLQKQFISRHVQSVRPKISHKLNRSLFSFYKAQYGLVDGVLWQIIPYCLQDFLQLVDGIWLGLKCLVAFKHSSPDMVIKRIKAW